MKVQSTELKSGRLLGKGSSGIVYETTWKGLSCARKDFLRAPSDIFEREAAALVGLDDHPNVARTYCLAVDEGSCSLVSELAEDDLLNFMRKRIKASRRKSLVTQKSKSHLILDLAKFIEDCKNSTSPLISSSELSHVTPVPFLYPFTVPDALHVIVQIAQGMKFLHDNKVVHGDLKPKNVLIFIPGGVSGSFDPNFLAFEIKVADFGLVETKMKSRTMVSIQARNWEMLRWRAPELLDLRTFLREDKDDQSDPTNLDPDFDSNDEQIGVHLHKFTYASDVYNFALTCSQILTGEDPYPGLGLNHDLVSKMTALRIGLRPRLPPRCPPQLRGLLETCWGESTERPNFQVILSKLKDLQQSLMAVPSTGDSENVDHVRLTGNLENLTHDDVQIGTKKNLDFTRIGDSEILDTTQTGENSYASSQKEQFLLKNVPVSSTGSDSAKRTSVPEQRTWRTMDTPRSSKLRQMEPRHFLGLDEEITWETRGIPTRNLPALKALTDLDELISVMKHCTTVVISVEEVRLFNAANLETARFRFNRKFYYSENLQEKVIRKKHVDRLKVIRAITAAPATLKTVSFIPGELDHVEQSLTPVLQKCWQIELSEFCANLHRNPNLCNLHIATKLSNGEGFRIDQLLNSSLVEISLPSMREEGWSALTLGLAANRSLRVLTLVWDAEEMESFMTRLWPVRNKTLETLVIACSESEHSFDLRYHSESVASILYRASCVSTFVLEYYPPAPTPKLTPLAICLREALLKSQNVRALHLHVPFHGEDVELILESFIATSYSSSPINTTLRGLVLVPDRWTKADLFEVGSMLSLRNNSITHFGIRHLNPKKKLSVRDTSQGIRKSHIVKFLLILCGNSTLRTLSLRGWSVIDGRDVLDAVLRLLRIQVALDIDLTGTGLAAKDKLIEPVNAQLQKNRESSDAASGTLDNNHPNSSSSYPAQPLTFFSPFTYAQVVDAAAKFQTPLGEREFGVVFQGDLPDGTRIAVKDLKLTSSVSTAARKRMWRSLAAEVQTLGLIHHVKLVSTTRTIVASHPIELV